MLHQLLESRRRPQRHPVVTALSVAAHVAVIALVVSRRGHASDRRPGDETILHPIYSVAPDPTRAAPTRGGRSAGPAPGRTTIAGPLVEGPSFEFRTTTVDLGTDAPPDEFGGATVSDALRGSGGGAAGGGTGDALTVDQVEKAAAALPGSPAPSYPAMLRAAGVEGRVLARFVVDTSGRVEPGSFRVVESTHELFASSVRAALPAMRYLPAEAGGHRVRQLVQQTFEFTIVR